MKKVQILDWRLDFGEKLDVEMLKSKFAPPQNYRISEYRYPAGVIVAGSMRVGKCFVLAGSCEYDFENSCRVELKHGEYTEVIGGKYQLRVGNKSDVHLIIVWELFDFQNLSKRSNEY